MMNRYFKRIAVIAITIMISIFYSTPGYTVQASAGSNQNIINVKDHGAKGDGRSDDTAAIQQILDSVDGNGATVYFPKGTYMINPSKTLLVNSLTKILGDGTSSIIKANDNNFGWELMRLHGHDIEIEGIVLDGNMAVNRILVIDPGSSAIKVSNSILSNATHSKDSQSEYYTGIVTGVMIYGNTDRITIDNTEVSHISAVNLTADSLIARGIYVTTSWGSNEKVGTNVSITNSHIHHIGPADDGDGIYYEDRNLENDKAQDTNSLIANNVFDNNAKRAIKLYAQGITVRDNRIVNSYLKNNYYYAGNDKGKQAPDMYAGISVYGSNNTIKNNTIGGVGSYYAAIEVSSWQTVNNVKIDGNQITMGAKSSTVGTTAIRLGNTKDFSIVNNQIENADKGIWTWQNAEKGSIVGNVIQATQGGIDLTTYVENCTQKNIVLRNNTIKGKAFNVQLAKTNVNVEVIS
ncbi:glycosyl hydrolase family 28-related protein [Paenibacillus segetis]|uniref:Pectate lyase superfamily protein domain-containing protein n=1 Tax=Paenibacillus segetis TaxID=1325360 RepID=A0ABQ1YQ18_9BACL|nr:glycosyl hydrolase family 28-related protein [Paenibacillus segetis]GGH32156.1 hypothetical protein GCM10008013_36390 [Paenibacillus segetis]